jgi:large subunit ribosomal protein L14
VDNSEIGKQAMAEGKPPKCIHIYNKKGIGTIGTYIYITLHSTDPKLVK